MFNQRWNFAALQANFTTSRHCLWENIRTTYRTSLEKFGQKSLAPSNICLFLHLCSKTAQFLLQYYKNTVQKASFTLPFARRLGKKLFVFSEKWCSIKHLLFVNDVVLLASSKQGFQYALDWFATAWNQPTVEWKISAKNLRYYVFPEIQVRAS